jgi:hypothetical protein
MQDRSPGAPIASFPLTDEGWAVAQAQFAAWEPRPPRVIAQPGQEVGHVRRGRRHRLVALSVAAVVVVAGAIGAGMALGGGSSKPVRLSSGAGTATASQPAGAPPVGGGYLAADAGSVVFIQWTDTKGDLDGTVEEVTTDGQPPQEQTANGTLTIKGTLQGGNLAVSFNGRPQTFGRLSGDSFTLNIPQADGTLAPVTFHAAAAAAFNSAVAALSQQVATANLQAAAAAAQQQSEQQVDKDASAVGDDVVQLVNAEQTLANDVQATTSDQQTEAKDLATTAAQEQQVSREAPTASFGQVCGDAAAVSGDASAVSGDSSAVSGYVSSVLADIATVNGGVGRLNADFAQFQADQAKVPGYATATPPNPEAVSQAAAFANKAVATATASTNGDIDRANADMTTAYGYAASAYQAGNCGSAPSAPPAMKHIGG